MVTIAMWSGPRNLSTALMYAFGNRPDCAVMDEPFYASFLARSGADHPMRAATLASQPIAADAVVAGIADLDAPIRYLKLMTHHMGPDVPLDWASDCMNVHLIRHPARVIASYAAKREEMTLEDIGFPQQRRLWQALPGPVIDSADIRADPARMLRRLCAEAGIPFSDAMLHWPTGPKPFDGAWAPHWYGAVHHSTGFAGPEGDLPDVPRKAQPLLAQALPIYEEMKAAALGL